MAVLETRLQKFVSSLGMALPGASSNNSTLDNLPLHEVASQLNIEPIVALEAALALATTRFVHRPSLNSDLNYIYSLPFEQWASDDWGTLPLLYTLLAIGCISENRTPRQVTANGYYDRLMQGYVDGPSEACAFTHSC